MVTRAARRVDDDDYDGPYDKNYPGQKVVADGGKVSVRLALTDGMPSWMPRWRPVFDASRHRPRYAVIDKADPVVRDAEAAYREGVRRLEDAWKTMPGGAGGLPHTTAPAAEPGGDDDDESMSPRDRYVAGLANAYRWTPGGDPTASANAVQNGYTGMLSPGARPGDGDARPTLKSLKDEAAKAHAAYCDRISNAWRTR
jgi:hypothetical protein